MTYDHSQGYLQQKTKIITQSNAYKNSKNKQFNTKLQIMSLDSTKYSTSS